MRCAFMVKSNDKNRGPVRDPFRAMNGWAVYLDVSAGRHGRPNISLQFNINNGKKDARVSRNPDQRTDFDITWCTGVTNDQRPLIEKFEACVVSEYPRNWIPPLIMRADNLSRGNQQEGAKLVTLTFKSNGEEKLGYTATDRKPWRGLNTDIQQCLDTLFFQDEPLWMTIWFCVDSNPDLAISTWILSLQHAVELSR